MALQCTVCWIGTAPTLVPEWSGTREAQSWWDAGNQQRKHGQLSSRCCPPTGRGVGFRSLTEQIDTTTPGGRLIFHVFGALAEFERALIVERTPAGLAAARARGRKGGRPHSAAMQDAKRLARARELYAERRMTVSEICRLLGISRSTFYAYVPDHATHLESRVDDPPQW
jgi:Resolvase, N terminal domain/Helix-turn-helix domain of resolvase